MKFKCTTASLAGRLARFIVKLGRGMGRSFPGYLFLRIGGFDCLRELSKRSKIGNILITGTNGKTTTTKMLCLLLKKDSSVSCNFDSNTVNAVATGLLGGKAEFGIFEYGIRTAKYSMPDTVCKYVDPIGVIYTTISREHTMVAGEKNPFREYFKAKRLLSAPMKKGFIICNADDPRTAFIGMEKEKDVQVAYYGLEVGLEDETPLSAPVHCPICEEKLEYSKRYLNHRGIYRCKCGFSRPEPHVKLTRLSKKDKKWEIEISSETCNYTSQKRISSKFKLEVPNFGIHNLYNFLCASTAYITFTPHPENIKETIIKTAQELEKFTLPPGRFEIFKLGDKTVGIGQGDNGDALKANLQVHPSDEMTLIYTTPDKGEDEIFQDHLRVIKSAKPMKIHVFPGRESTSAARNYYKTIKEYFDASFHPISNKEMDKKIDEILGIIDESSTESVMVSGCGPEHLFWNKLKSKFKSTFI
ncbi:Mur ligase family protein [Methanothermobacter tenebrarum]|uniref:UDP-N-acetylmuramyl peptide synthase n=1 Tax=Methanothermobacter tenebrarum TaxID=680118 RepID=A0A328P991_9EURY|nr:Mur ligase family protein [Methanothermobacter tenebrarum]NPV64765.1 UDP-N-acetylmuramyl peptide synthase [Methanobacteriaceae archaeon]RAO78649.1 UDP-N-acetylmuramyl peptide synthase [Methanothermobacter tenebrarum]